MQHPAATISGRPSREKAAYSMGYSLFTSANDVDYGLWLLYVQPVVFA
jgi:hypothetical protein